MSGNYRSRIAAQFSRILRKPSNSEYLITGNYLVDYQDSLRRFGTILQGIIIANPSTNIPEVIYVTLNNYGSGTHINHLSVSFQSQESLSRFFSRKVRILINLIIISFFLQNIKLYIKAEGVFHSLATFDNPTNIKDILKKFKLDERKKNSVHLEIIARIQEKTVLCVHWNETKIVEGLKCKRIDNKMHEKLIIRCMLL